MLAVLTLLFAAETAAPPPASAPKVEILGLWKGTSICAPVEAAEFCHDETVAYNFVDLPDRPGTVSLNAAKVKDGSVRPLYSIYFNYRSEEGRWTSEYTRGRTHGLWSYVVKGDAMTGTLVLLPEGVVVRNVSVKRVSKDQVSAP